MTKGLAEIPTIKASGQDFWLGFHLLQAKMAQEHGPIFKSTEYRDGVPVRDYVFMVGPEANRFVLHTHREHFSHNLGWTPIVGEDLGHGLLNMDGAEHARHRKMWNPAFTSAYLETYLPIINRVIADRTSTWLERGEIDMYEEAREITFDAAAAALGGFRPGQEVDRLRRFFYMLLHGFDPAEESYETFAGRWSLARAEMTETLLGLIRLRRAAPRDQQPTDVLGMIVHARDENGDELSDEQVLAHINILLVAGHETTTTLGSWVLYLLATETEHAANVRDELQTLMGDEDKPLTVEALRAMKALDLFIRETGRLYSPVLNVPRGVVKPFEFGGYEVPAGTQVRLALAASHRLPTVFTDPEVFDPERFAPPREEDRRTPYSLVTFGSGPRICIGINFAQIETKALVAHVLRHFDLTPVPDQQLLHAGHWTAVLPYGMKMRVEPAREHQIVERS